jgi:hypothetical protein
VNNVFPKSNQLSSICTISPAFWRLLQITLLLDHNADGYKGFYRNKCCWFYGFLDDDLIDQIFHFVFVAKHGYKQWNLWKITPKNKLPFRCFNWIAYVSTKHCFGSIITFLKKKNSWKSKIYYCIVVAISLKLNETQKEPIYIYRIPTNLRWQNELFDV